MSEGESTRERTVAMVTPSSIACEAPCTEVGRNGCAASPINAIRACFEIHYHLSTHSRDDAGEECGGVTVGRGSR